MAKPTIVTRAGKGSALTWTEGDTNLTNLRDATITVTDGTNSKAIDLNGSITFTAGTNVTLSVNSSTGAVTINSSGGSGIASVSADTNPSLGGDLNVNGKIITSASNGNVVIQPNGTGEFKLVTHNIFVGDLDTDVYIRNNVTSISANQTRLLLTNAGSMALYSGTAGALYIDASANSSTGNVTITPGSAAKSIIKQINYNEGPIYDLGTTGGTIAPNVTNGNVQKITLNSALTINAFTSPVAGQSVTLIIYGGTAYTSITSTMKFAGGIKTLTGTAGCIDILSVYYDGTNYFASLNKGFA